MTPDTSAASDRSALTEFAAIDHASERAEHFVACLDAIDEVPATLAWRRRILEYLECKPGDAVLEIGCGTGELARVLPGILGDDGRVVAIDKSSTMIDQARERTPDDLAERIEYRVGDVGALDLPTASFDAVVAERVFVHLANRGAALAGIVAVARPGARIVLNDPDLETTLISSPIEGAGRDVARRIANHWCDACLPNGWAGRENAELMVRAGLVDVRVGVDCTLVRDLATANAIMLLRGRLDDAISGGIVTVDEGKRWWAGLEELDAMGAIVASAGLFTTVGRKPDLERK